MGPTTGQRIMGNWEQLGKGEIAFPMNEALFLAAQCQIVIPEIMYKKDNKLHSVV